MTSPRGRCHTFDMRADGYARGEATCTITMQLGRGRVAYRGSGVRQDGRSASLTAPNGLSQQGVLRAAFANAAIEPRSLGFSEAHGTGTALGDPIEVAALAVVVFNAERSSNLPVTLGSAKASVGHSEPTAGANGLVNVILEGVSCMPRPNAQLQVLNPHLSKVLRSGGCGLPTHLLRMGCFGAAATGAVSSFGYVGTIAHLSVTVYESVSWTMAATGAQFRRRSFWWHSRQRLIALSMHELVLASRKAEKALDAALVDRGKAAPPHLVEVAVVGAGMAGLIVLSAFASLCDVICLERSNSVGGVWHTCANPFSRVNSSEPSYRLPVSKNVPNTNHSHHTEILEDTLSLIMQRDLIGRIFTKIDVTKVEKRNGEVNRSQKVWLLEGKAEAVEREVHLQSSVAVLCVNRRLGAPRNLVIPGEAHFNGKILRGLFGDTKGLKASGKRVLLLGMGAFALENMRTCLEMGAVHSTIVARRRGAV